MRDRRSTAAAPRRDTRPIKVSILGLIGSLSACLLVGQVLPMGPEVRVASSTTAPQASPQITMGPDGTFMVFWCCAEVEEEGERRIVGQRFDSDAMPIGEVFVVNEHSTDFPAAAATEGGGEVVLVWGDGSPGCPPCSADYVKGRRLTAEGVPIGSQFEVGTPPGGGYTGDASVAAHGSGGFVVSWYDYGVLARRYDGSGSPLGGEFEVDGSGAYAASPSIAASPNGGFVVVWTEPEGDWTGAIRGRRYDGDGMPTGGLIDVASEYLVSAEDPVVSSSDTGDFVVAWERYPLGPAEHALEARRFDASGNPLGPSQLVNSSIGGRQTRPAMARESDGGFVVAWLTLNGVPDPLGIYARRFDPEGIPLGLEFQLATDFTADVNDPQIVVAPSGDLVAVWSSDLAAGPDKGSSSILLRRFRVPFFIDGFESGDRSRWSSTTP